MSDLEQKKQMVKDLIEKGKKRGVLSNNDIVNSFFDTEITPEEIETVYDALEKEGVEIVDDEELTPVKFGKKEDKLYVSRIRAIKGQASSFTLVAVMDNFLRGVVLNCMGIIRKLGLK